MSYSITILNHNDTSITPITEEVVEALSYQHKSYTPRQGFKFKKANVLYTADGITPTSKNRFPTGLVSHVVHSLTKPFSIEDYRIFPPAPLRTPQFREGFTLRDYQIDYLMKACVAQRAIIKADTGAGKTAIIAALIATYNLPTLLIVPNNTVFHQLSTELSKILSNPPQIHIALARNLIKHSDEYLQSFLLIADEAHTCAASQAMDVIRRANAPFRFGMTATPTGRGDSRDLIVEGLFGPLIEEVTHAELKEAGFHPELHVDIHYNGFAGDYVYMEDLLIVNNLKRNQLIVDLVKKELKQGGIALILVRRIEHGRNLYELLIKDPPGGGQIYYVNGSTSSDHREVIRQECKEGKVRCIIGTSVVYQGLDIPELTVGINAAGGKAEILTQQKMGRMTRPFEGQIKKWVDLYDDFGLTLKQHSIDRIKLYKDNADKLSYKDFPMDKQHKVEEAVKEL